MAKAQPDLNLKYHFPASYSPQKFEINVDKNFVDFTKRKVLDYRPTVGFSNEWNVEGPPTGLISDIAKYWGTEYNWETIEQKINNDFDHYSIIVPGNGNYPDDIPLHFIHERSEDDDAVPLLLLHGWPSSYLEWSKVVKPLAQSTGQSYHIVAPDLPGFGFSPAPQQPGMGPLEMGRAFDSLMKKLGYNKYGLVTTDLGWFTGMWMVHELQDSIIGHMTDFFTVPPNATDYARVSAGEVTSEEKAYIESYDAWFSEHWTYADVHARKPLALSLALGDSPVGFLGWYMDVNYATSDGYDYSFEELVTDAMMLWIPGPYANMRAYREIFKPELLAFQKTNVPTGVSEWGWRNGPFPKINNFANLPRDWIERVANLQYFNRHETGGHFPAVTQPKDWVQDVQAFFAAILPKKESSPNQARDMGKGEL